MNSKILTLEVSWANIESWILTGLHSLKGIPAGVEVHGLSIQNVPKDQLVKILVNTKEDEGADITYCR